MKLDRLSVVAAAFLVMAAVPATAMGFKGFQSPSHNIGCVMSKSVVRCDIAKHSWKAPPKPKSCQLDYGNGLTLSKHGRAHYTCAGDTVLHQGRVLRYGSSISLGRFRCTSKTSGMRCVNRRNGHGFFLSRQRAKRF